MTASLEPYDLTKNRQPLYVQAVAAIRRYIKDEQVSSGELLPSEPDLARLLGVGRSTIREAMGHLELVGLIERRRGVGTVMIARPSAAAVGLETLEPFESLAERQGWTCTTEDIQIELVHADGNEFSQLQAPEASALTVIERTKLRDGDPIAVMKSVLPNDVLAHETLRDEFRDPITQVLLHQLEFQVRCLQSKISAVACTAPMASRLALIEGEPLVTVEELFLGDAEKPLAWNLLHLVPGRIDVKQVRWAVPQDGQT